MDRAEAIKAMQFYKGKLYNGIYNQYIEAFDVAIAALREQEQREHGCVNCNGGFGDNTMEFRENGYVFCPMCGRKLTKGE